MADIRLNNGDINGTLFNDISLVYDDDEIIQSAINNIMTIYGENQFHKELGNITFIKRNKMSSNNLIQVANDCKNAIINDKRVKSVTNVTINQSSTIYGGCDVMFTIVTTSGNSLSSIASINIIGGE